MIQRADRAARRSGETMNGPGKGAARSRFDDARAPTHSPDGVDLTLIRWMLSLTPLERLETLQTTLDSIARLRGEAAEG